MSYESDDQAPLTEEEAERALRRYGPRFASRFASEAVTNAIALIRQHAQALNTLGMTAAADDLFEAIHHIKPLPSIVSSAYGMELSEKINMQRGAMGGIMALALAGASKGDAEIGAVAKGFADAAVKHGELPTYEPMESDMPLHLVIDRTA